MNKPYVKEYDENGKLINPIKGSYVSEFANRAARRNKPNRFRGNQKGISLTVVKTDKYKRTIQLIQIIERDKKGRPLAQTVENNHITIKQIKHYV